MVKQKKSKEERQSDRQILDRYHEKVTEDALAPLYINCQEWKNGKLPYYELTEKIHEFYKINQKIWTKFNYAGVNDEFLIFQAKKELNLLNEEEKVNYQLWLKEWDD
jgi:hypothetical protein